MTQVNLFGTLFAVYLAGLLSLFWHSDKLIREATCELERGIYYGCWLLWPLSMTLGLALHVASLFGVGPFVDGDDQ